MLLGSSLLLFVSHVRIFFGPTTTDGDYTGPLSMNTARFGYGSCIRTTAFQGAWFLVCPVCSSFRVTRVAFGGQQTNPWEPHSTIPYLCGAKHFYSLSLWRRSTSTFVRFLRTWKGKCRVIFKRKLSDTVWTNSEKPERTCQVRFCSCRISYTIKRCMAYEAIFL